jgi:hypothetical protein
MTTSAMTAEISGKLLDLLVKEMKKQVVLDAILNPYREKLEEEISRFGYTDLDSINVVTKIRENSLNSDIYRTAHITLGPYASYLYMDDDTGKYVVMAGSTTDEYDNIMDALVKLAEQFGVSSEDIDGKK